MSYTNVLKTDMAVRSIIVRCFKLLPSAAVSSFKLGTLFIIFNAFAFCVAYYLHRTLDDYISVQLIFGGTVFLVNNILAYTSVKIMMDIANGTKHRVIRAIEDVVKLFFPTLTASLLIVLSVYFTLMPAAHLIDPARYWYLFISKIIYIFFIPYIMFFPWKILEGQNVFEAFNDSYELVKNRWGKYALLFFCSLMAVSFLFLLLIALPASFLSGDYYLVVYRLNRVLGETVPVNSKIWLLVGLMKGYGLKMAFSFIVLMLFYAYSLITSINILNLIFSVGYKTLKDYKLIADSASRAQDIKPVIKDDFEIENFLKDAKEVSISTNIEDTSDESALGHQDRAETLRQFHKEDDTVIISDTTIIHEYPDPDDDNN